MQNTNWNCGTLKGNTKYSSLIKGYLKGADVCILVYDAANKKKF